MDPAILEQLNRQNEELDRTYDEFFGAPAYQLSVDKSPKYQAITKILKENPLLVEPCLNWLQLTQARISQATLNVLYTPEQLEELKTRLEGELKQ